MWSRALSEEGRQKKMELAEDMNVGDMSATFKLRKDAKFHDGRPITSADVQVSVETVRDHHPFKTMFAPVNGVTLTDAHTAVIRLSEPHPALLLAMSSALLPILPRHIYGDGQPIATHPRNANPVGSGPFKLVEFKPGEHIVMERFDGFFVKDRPLLDRFIIRFYKDPSSMLLALERGELPEAESEVETEESRAREIVMLGLRLACGLHAEDYPAADWAGVRARYGAAFDRALAQGRLERCGEGLRVAPAHRFVADDVIAWLDAAATAG
jgi:ABC-type transport system substrate-binding protein